MTATIERSNVAIFMSMTYEIMTYSTSARPDIRRHGAEKNSILLIDENCGGVKNRNIHENDSERYTPIDSLMKCIPCSCNSTPEYT